MNAVLHELQSGFEEGLAGLTPAQTQRRTGGDPARWSIQQIVEHLLMTYSLSGEVFEERIGKGTATKAKPTVRQRAGQIVVLRLGRFPQGRAAPAMVIPRKASEELLAGEELVRLTREALGRFDELAAKAEALFGNRRAITHQILGPLTVDGWRRFHLAHGLHHLKQVRAIRSASGLAGDGFTH